MCVLGSDAKPCGLNTDQNAVCCTGGRATAAMQNGAAPAAADAAADDDDDDKPEPALKPFKRLTKAAVEALRYRAEDVARSLTKAVVKEVISSSLYSITPECRPLHPSRG